MNLLFLIQLSSPMLHGIVVLSFIKAVTVSIFVILSYFQMIICFKIKVCNVVIHLAAGCTFLVN